MYATIRRYEGVDVTRTNEVTNKIKQTLVPQLRKLPGFEGYYLIEATDDEQAQRVAERCPAAFGYIEVRPIWDFAAG